MMEAERRERILIQLGREMERKRVRELILNHKLKDGTPALVWGRTDLVEFIEQTGALEDRILNLSLEKSDSQKRKLVKADSPVLGYAIALAEAVLHKQGL